MQSALKPQMSQVQTFQSRKANCPEDVEETQSSEYFLFADVLKKKNN